MIPGNDWTKDDTETQYLLCVGMFVYRVCLHQTTRRENIKQKNPLLVYTDVDKETKEIMQTKRVC